MLRAYNKFSAKKTEVDGIIFASKREAARYQELKLMEKGGLITGFRIQFPYVLTVIDPWGEERRVGKYIADFVYSERNGNSWMPVVEDCKGMRTPLYKWKKKHFEAQYGISIKET